MRHSVHMAHDGSQRRLDVTPLKVQWLICILIGCVVYSMAYIHVLNENVHLDELRYTAHLDIDVPHATAVRQMDCSRILMYRQ